MSEELRSICYGAIEGITEFLPISSTGHLLIAERWLGGRSDLFITVIQCGAVLAVLIAFTARLRQLIGQAGEPKNRDYLSKLALAFILTVIGGLILKKAGWKLPDTVGPVAWATLIGGVVILGIERAIRNKVPQQEITWLLACAFAGGQLIAAVFPGASRSGSTILIAMALGLSRPAATEFSFLLGIPTLFAAGALEIFSGFRDGTAQTENWTQLAIAFVTATITAFLVVKWLLRFIQSHTFAGFGWYRIALGIVLLALIGR